MKKINNNLLFQVSSRQVQPTVGKTRTPKKKETFHKADKDQLPAKHTETYILTMLPQAKGDTVFNRDGEQEWEIQKNTDTIFAIYGM